MKPLLHKRTSAQIEGFLEQPGHSLLVIGMHGIGKSCVARSIIEQALQLEPGSLERYPYFTLVTPEQGSISIEAVRELKRTLQLKTTGKKALRRAVLIEHAETLTTEAQNACLKLLEEPPEDTLLILTASSQHNLLPTILSRVQQLTVYPPDEQAVKQYFAPQAASPAALEQAYLLSGGCPGLLTALLADAQEHPLVRGVTIAKDILQKPLFERMLLVDTLSKQKADARSTLDALERIARTAISQAAAQSDATKLKRWHRVLKAAVAASLAMDANANAKLVLSELALRI